MALGVVSQIAGPQRTCLLVHPVAKLAARVPEAFANLLAWRLLQLSATPNL